MKIEDFDISTFQHFDISISTFSHFHIFTFSHWQISRFRISTFRQFDISRVRISRVRECVQVGATSVPALARASVSHTLTRWPATVLLARSRCRPRRSTATLLLTTLQRTDNGKGTDKTEAWLGRCIQIKQELLRGKTNRKRRETKPTSESLLALRLRQGPATKEAKYSRPDTSKNSNMNSQPLASTSVVRLSFLSKIEHVFLCLTKILCRGEVRSSLGMLDARMRRLASPPSHGNHA